MKDHVQERRRFWLGYGEKVQDAIDTLDMLSEGLTDPHIDTESVVKYTGPFISTWKQGHLKVLYSHLVRTFGPPHETENLDKTDAEWTFMTPAGVATIYNYKNGVAYNGIGGTPIKDICEWNIGGTNGDVVSYIKDVIF